MSVSQLYTVYNVKLNTTVLNVTEQSLPTETQRLLHAASGNIDGDMQTILGQRPAIEFTTPDIKAALAVAGIDGSFITTGNLFKAACRRMATGGVRGGATSHVLLTINKGMLVPRQVTATQGGIATLSYRAHAFYDGTNNPVTVALAQTISDLPVADTVYTLGPVKLDGVDLGGEQGMTLDFGITEAIRAASGDVWPSDGAIMSRASFATINSFHVNSADNSIVPLAGRSLTTSAVIWLRQKAPGGGNYADTLAKHISFTMAKCLATFDTVGGAHGGEQTISVRLDPYKGTPAHIAIATDAQIVIP